MTWLQAFVLTQVLEMPVYLWGFRGTALDVPMRLAVAFGASALTHPFVWYVFYPTLLGPLGYWGFFFVTEGTVVVVETLYLRAFGVPQPFRWALSANAFSAGVGLLLGPLL
ncbi:MAG: hypothetical protein KC656_17495 [Myxococcales bacterium]|nr:hypothetical protein [Myxococcales bacterium]MCB9694384.1 hypothetical protein [Alphaproteobacteria bacterium]